MLCQSVRPIFISCPTYDLLPLPTAISCLIWSAFFTTVYWETLSPLGATIRHRHVAKGLRKAYTSFQKGWWPTILRPARSQKACCSFSICLLVYNSKRKENKPSITGDKDTRMTHADGRMTKVMKNDCMQMCTGWSGQLAGAAQFREWLKGLIEDGRMFQPSGLCKTLILRRTFSGFYYIKLNKIWTDYKL